MQTSVDKQRWRRSERSALHARSTTAPYSLEDLTDSLQDQTPSNRVGDILLYFLSTLCDDEMMEDADDTKS